jgi:hypothetical protein
MARPPTRDFGKRQPAVVQTAPPVKRSGHVALLLMGTVAVGGGAYALTSGQNCQPKSPAMATPSSPQTGTECSSRGYFSGGHGGSWTRHSFYGGDSASGSSPSSPASGSSSSSVTRGGFGSFAHAFASHFSGGG